MPIKLMRFLLVLIVGTVSVYSSNARATLAMDTVQRTDAIKYDIDAMKYMLNSTKFVGTVYKEVCKTGGGICETDIFNHTQVQMVQAMALAQEYGRVKHNRNLICSPQYRRGSWLNKLEDYVKCTDSTGRHFYEFKFDDVKESVDSTIQKSVFAALCYIYGGKTTSSSEVCVLNSCSALNTSLKLFGYGANAKKMTNGATYCYANFRTKSSDYKLKNPYNLNPRVFADMQIRSIGDLEILLQHYVEHQLAKQNKQVSSFSCNSSFNTLRTGELLNLKDDILVCRINNQDMDFVFDDMQEAFNSVADAGIDGLRCITQAGGTYLGNHCRGITKQECLDAGVSMAGGTHWDDEMGLCTLNSAKTAEQVARWTNVGIGVAVVGVTVMTGGTATVVLVAAGTATSIVGAEVSGNANNARNMDAGDFVDMAKKCNDKSCAGKILTHYYTLVYDNVGGFNNAAIDSLKEYESKLLSLVQDDIQAGYACYYKSLATDEQKQRAKNITAKNIAGNAMIIVGAVVSIAGGKYGATAKGVTGTQKLIGQIKQLRTSGSVKVPTAPLQRLLSNVTKGVDKFGDAWDVNSARGSSVNLTADVDFDVMFDCDAICSVAGVCGKV